MGRQFMVLGNRLVWACTALLMVSSARAAVWTGGSGTDWNEGGNWAAATVPGVGETADLRLSGANHTINYGSPMVATSFGRLLMTNSPGFFTTLSINATGFVSSATSYTDPTVFVGANTRIVVGAGGFGVFESTRGHRFEGGHLLVENGGSFAMKTSAGLYDAVVFTAGSTVTNNGGSLSLTPVDADKVRVLLAGGAKMVQASGESEMGRKLVSLGAHNQANGFIDVSGGTLHLSAAQVQLGTGNASGTITVSGGEVENAGTMQLGFDTFSGAGGWLNLSAGTWRQVNGGLVAVGDKRGETSAINVTGTGAFFTTGNVVLGQTPYSSELAKASGVLLVDGGSFTATNAAGDAALTLKRGTLRIRNGGTLAVDSLATGDSGADAKVDFTGGALAVGTATISNTLVTVVGNGVDAATLSLGAGPHLFFDGLQIRAQSTLQTTGGVTVRGAGTTVEAGGALRLDGEWIEDSTVVFDSDLTIGSGSTLTYAYGFDMRSNPAIAVTGNLALPDVLTIELDALREANGFGVALFTYDTLDPVPDVRQWTVTGIPGCWVEHDPGNSRILVIRPPLATVIAIR